MEMTYLCLNPPTSCAPWKSVSIVGQKQFRTTSINCTRNFGAKSFFPTPDERIIKEALTEPVAFMGGIFAGLLRLDLNEDPLKEWVTRTVEASGITEEIDLENNEADEVPQQIDIE